MTSPIIILFCCFLTITNQLISGSLDMTSKIFDIRTGQIMKEFKFDTRINSVAINNKNESLINSGNSFDIIKNQKNNIEEKFSQESIFSKSVFSNCGNQVVVCSLDKTFLMEIDSGKIINLGGLKGEIINRIAISDDIFIIISTQDGMVRIFDEEGTLRFKYKDIESFITSIGISPFIHSFAIGHVNGLLNVYYFDTINNEYKHVSIKNFNEAVSCVIIGHKYLLSSGDNGLVNIQRIDKISNDWHQETIKINCTVRSMAFEEDESKVAFGCTNGMIEIWDLESLKLINRVKAHNDEVTTLALRSDD